MNGDDVMTGRRKAQGADREEAGREEAGREEADRVEVGRAGEPLAERAYRRLLDTLREGGLQPGDRVREADIAADLRISRTPVREALKRLESEGLLTTTPYRGMSVAQLDYQQVMELYLMREVLEGTAAGLAARHASEAEIVALSDIVESERRVAGDAAARAGHNRRFHNAIYYAAHNRYLLRSLNSFRDAMVLLGPTTYTVPGRAETALGEHREVLAAIRERDPDRAEAAARAHIRAAQRARLQIINEAANDEDQDIDRL
jgi:DNA-binding GntR family transcriptional regulator